MNATTFLRTAAGRTAAFGLALGLALLGACGGGGSGDGDGGGVVVDPPPGTLVRIEVSPKAMTFTATGAARTITVKGFDAAGHEVAVTAPTFTSSDPAFATVGATGAVQPLSALGSAVIDVKVGTIAAPPVTVLAIKPAAGVALVGDEQIASAPAPIAGSKNARVTLNVTPAPAVGSLLLGTGGVPLGGRVVAVSTIAGASTVDLEDVPITELVTDLNLKLSLTPAQVNAGLPAGPFKAKGEAVRAKGRDGRHAIKLGPFTCDTDTDYSALQGELEGTLQPPEIGFVVSHTVTASQKKATTVLAVGDMKASLKGVLRFGATFGGEVACSAQIVRIVAPVFGLASLVAAPVLPVNALFSAAGEISVAGFSFGATDELKGVVDVGFTYTEGAGAVAHHGFDVSNEFEPVATVPGEQGPRAKVKVFAGLGSALEIGIGNLGMFSLGDLELVTLEAGPELEIRVASPYTTAADASFDSGYDLKAKVEFGPGEAVGELLEHLLPPGVALELSFKLEKPISASPQTDQLKVDKDRFALGDTLKFTIDFKADDLKFLLWNYNLKQLRVYRIDNDTMTATEVARADAAAGQTHFEMTWVADLGGASVGGDGKPTFVAYVVDVPLSVVSSAWPFELGPLSAQVDTEKRIAAAAAASLVIRDDGRVVIRGSNAGGALGLGTPIGEQREATVMPTLSDVKAVTGSNWASVALLKNGQVYAWGWGDCIGLPQKNNPLPVLIDDNVGARNVAISTGYGHSLILKEGGSVWSFGGSRAAGGASNGGPIDTRLGPATAIAAGNTVNAVLRADGTVWTMGQGSRGQLGNGSLADSTVPVMVQGLTDVVALAAGDSFVLALRRDGRVWAWGENRNGQLGIGTTVDAAVPVEIPGLVNVSSIAAGEHHGMALANGVVYTWGFNGVGVLGTGDKLDRLLPVQVLTGAREIDGSESTSLAALANGTVMGWGSNDAGQIGNNRTTNAITRPSDTLLRVGPR